MKKALWMTAALAAMALRAAAEAGVGPYFATLNATGDSEFGNGLGGGLKFEGLAKHWGGEVRISHVAGSDEKIGAVTALEFGVLYRFKRSGGEPYLGLGFGLYKPEDIDPAKANFEDDDRFDNGGGGGLYALAGWRFPLGERTRLFVEGKYTMTDKGNHTKSVGGDGNVTYVTPDGEAGFDMNALGIGIGVLWTF